jgi:hypothetical protein
MHTHSLEEGIHVGWTVIHALLVIFAGVWITRNDQIGIATTGKQE